MSLTRRALCLSALGLVLAPTLAKAGPKRLIDMRGRVKHSRDAVFGILVGNSNQKNPAVSPLH